ncbi:MAG: peptidyl-prolyl cis-trans isomerase [Lentisphaeraceae bacterium]|nr:peptidyl-prolyl cis-trans isomerase [Lentisphaeraceae bacterium]
MFSKLNQEFASHQKGFQILLGIVIIVPFVLMIPGVDPFGASAAPKPSSVGKIAGESVSWDAYEKEARNVLAFMAINGNVNVLGNARNIISDDRFVSQVLEYMAEKKIVEDQVKAGVISDKVEAKDFKEFTDEIEKFMSKQMPGFTVSSQIENIRVRLRIGGAEVDEIISAAILRKRLEDALKKKVEVPEADVVAEVKKQEKTYTLREGNFNAPDFTDVPLKEYYEKNKEKFFQKDAIKASMVQIDYSKFKDEYKKLNVAPELTKFIADELKNVDNKDPKVKESTEKAAKQAFEQKKLKELANAKAELIKSGFLRSVKGAKDSAKFAEAIKKIAEGSKYEVQQSVYVDPSDVKEGKFFMNDKALSEKILGLSVENPVVLHEGFRSTYVIVFNDKGAHAEFETVRDDILRAVYEADANNYYITNKEEFKEPHRMRIGLAEFTASMYAAETKVSDAQIKKEYDKEASYKKAQRKLIQFAVDVDPKAKDEDKKKLEEKIKAFVATNQGKQPTDIESIILKAEEGVKKTTLNWKIQNSLEIGTTKDFMEAAFKTEVGNFTDVLKTDKSYAVIYVAGKRESTPFEEVKGELKSRLEAEISKDIAKNKSKEFHEMLRGVNPKTVESINKAVEEYGQKNPLQLRYIDDIMPIQSGMDPRFYDFMARRHQISGDFFFNISNLTEKRLFTNVRTIPPAYQRIVGFINKDIPEHYAPYEDEKVQKRIFNILNANKAKEIASAKAVKVKQELELAAEDKDKLKALLTEHKFKAAKDVKYKNAAASLKDILKDSPGAGFIGSDSKQEGDLNTVAYVEAVKEVSEEDLKKSKAEHEKKLRQEKESEVLKTFWETERKKYTVEVPKTQTVES